MCDICNGGTWDDVLLRKHLAIESHGWSYTAVMSDLPGKGMLDLHGRAHVVVRPP